MKPGLLGRTAGALLLAAVAMAPVGAGARDTGERVDRLTLEQQLGAARPASLRRNDAPRVRPRSLAWAAGGRGDPVPRQHHGTRSAPQTHRRSSRCRGSADRRGRPGGGDVRILRWAPPFASEAEQAAAGTVGSSATRGARALRAAGITVSLAPVGDVPSVPRAALAPRAFSRDPAEAGRAMAAAVAGWRAGGVAPTAKHFPGLGGARLNTDRSPVTITRSRANLEAVDLPPFEAAIRAGVPLVMVWHARYPALDRRHIASQSRTIVEGLLRERLGFRGVVVTDSMRRRRPSRPAALRPSPNGPYAPEQTSWFSQAGARTRPSTSTCSQSHGARRRSGRAFASRRLLALKERGARPPR